jgi:hypothetical protein
MNSESSLQLTLQPLRPDARASEFAKSTRGCCASLRSA